MRKVFAGTGITQVRLRSTVGPGESELPQLVNGDGSLSSFSLATGQQFLLVHALLQPESVPTAAILVDVSLVQVTPAGDNATRWEFGGALEHNFLAYFGEVGMLFSTEFRVVSDGLSQGTMIVDLWGTVVPATSITDPPLQLVATVKPGESVAPQLMNADGTLSDFTSPTGGFGIAVISIHCQSIVGTETLLDVSLVQQPNIVNGFQSVTRWAMRGRAAHNYELSFRGGAGALDFTDLPTSPLSIQSGAQSGDVVVVRLLCWPAITGLVELVATVAAGGSVVPQLQNADGSQSPFPTIPDGEVFRLLALSVERQTPSASAALIGISLTQTAQSGATQNRWTLIDSLSRNFHSDMGFDTGMSFSTPMSIESLVPSEDTVVVHLWGVIGVPSESLGPVVELSASLSPGEGGTPQFRNPDGTLAPFSLSAGQGFFLSFASVRRLSVVCAPLLVDVSLTQVPPAGPALSRWGFRGSAQRNIERFFYPGLLFTTPFEVNCGQQSSDALVVTLLGFLTNVTSTPPAVGSFTDLVATVAPGQVASFQVVNSDGSLSALPSSGIELFVEDISINRQALTGATEPVSVSLMPAATGLENWWSFHGNMAGNIENTLLGGVFFFAQGSAAAPVEVENDPSSTDTFVVHLWGEQS
jgi:hypothetical protein